MKNLRLIFQLLCALCLASICNAQQLRFSVTYSPEICDSFSGRVYVMTSAMGEPRFGPAWFGTQPFFAVDVKDWKPDTPLNFDDHAICFPSLLSQIAPGGHEYQVQAVFRRNLDSPSIGGAEGNAYSANARLTLNGATGGDVHLRIDQTVSARPFAENDRIKLVELRSELLSKFHGRDILMRAAVIFPHDYDKNLERKYPALYWIGGFGSDHRSGRMMLGGWERTGSADAIARIVLDPSCYGGHHVFADSENNGPRGRALVEEFIPHLERTFRLASSPSGRFLSGHSSGGWSSLWLQITYPDFFGGVWSIAPDPVDFRDFQRIDLYQPRVNMYVDEAGQRRPLARNDGGVMAWYDEFARMEVVYGEGGQLRSFDWVFSPRGADGLPLEMFDRRTGSVNASVAEAWQRYDIRLVLERNWAELAPKLQGKLRILMGDQDTFYLEGATKLLKQSLETLGSDAVVEIVAGRDHGTIMSPALRKRIDRELLEVFQQAVESHSTQR